LQDYYIDVYVSPKYHVTTELSVNQQWCIEWSLYIHTEIIIITTSQAIRVSKFTAMNNHVVMLSTFVYQKEIHMSHVLPPAGSLFRELTTTSWVIVLSQSSVAIIYGLYSLYII